MKPWIFLLLAGLLEIVWATGLKHASMTGRPWVVAVTVVAMIASMSLLGLALRDLPVGTAYAIWTGIGIVGTTVLGILWLGESASALKLVCIALILVGVIGLKAQGS